MNQVMVACILSWPVLLLLITSLEGWGISGAISGSVGSSAFLSTK